MGEPLADFSAEGVSRSSCLCHNTCLDPGSEHCCACCEVDFEAEIDDGQNDLVEEIGKAFAEVIHVYDHDGPDLGEESDENDESPFSLESDSADDLVDADPEAVILPALGSDIASESSGVSSDEGNSTSTYGTPKLVSAIKGTRAKQGIVTKLSVSWAPDVYDPPVTSDSHTVKVHQRGSRNARSKYKSTKSSSSGSTNSNKKDKKHSRHNGSSGTNKKDRRHSYHSISTVSGRADASGSNYRKAYSSSTRSETLVTECAEASRLTPTRMATFPPLMPTEKATLPPLMPTEKAALSEAIPVLKTMEQSKCATSCSKEKPFALLSRQFSAARYKGMFSLWSQNQLAS